MPSHSLIGGYGFALPPKTIPNSYFTEIAGTADEWIVLRTGISERHVLEDGQTGSDLAAQASRMALHTCGREASDITHILYATCTADSSCPSSACVLAAKLDIKNIMAVDVNAACSGFINCLELADAITARSPSARVLLVAAESLFQRCNLEDRSTSVLFGDGAGVVLVERAKAGEQPSSSLQPKATLVDVQIGSDGSLGNLLLMNGGFASVPYKLGATVGPEYFIRMNGGLVFKHAVRHMCASCLELLNRNGLGVEDVDLFVPHQANLRIIESVGAKLGIAGEKVFLNVQKYGNTSAASVPIALGEALLEGRVREGMLVLITTFGAGLTWGSALLKF
ncbi:MAG: beta-ketoacyl-ACP synthase 3 [Desulfovibrio sp.]|jgi:3-oxoacyl-[acyl-carrier-protein] synthase-3|nr:beta-ketoacyl-ACP synthase 3 [Desulfovibrio sp.]